MSEDTTPPSAPDQFEKDAKAFLPSVGGPDDVRQAAVALERENEQLLANLNAEKQRTDKLRRELSATRVRCARLERQLQGYDEDAFDPGKQKGIGAIPVDIYGVDLSKVEAIEARLGMAPTTDQQMRALGSSIAEGPGRLLTGGADAPALEPDADQEYIDAVVSDDQARLMDQALQLLWAYRVTGKGGLSALAERVDALPIRLFRSRLDLDGWDLERDLLPTIKPRED